MCSMDFQAPGSKAKEEHDHLEKMTVGKYFANKVMPAIIDNICNDPTIDLEALNEEWRLLAMEGLMDEKELVDRAKNDCPMCEKPKGNQSALECNKCKIDTHVKCVIVDKLKLDKYKKKIEVYECYQCYRGLTSNIPVNPKKAAAIDLDNGDLIVIDDEDLQCDICDFKTKDNNVLKSHKISDHTSVEIKCKECGKDCKIKKEMENHF